MTCRSRIMSKRLFATAGVSCCSLESFLTTRYHQRSCFESMKIEGATLVKNDKERLASMGLESIES